MENKVTKEIFNPINENIKKLESLFPGVVKDGQVDFESLKQELGQFEEVGKEKYELTWPGKTQAKQLANTDIIGRTLKYVPEDSKNPETTENLYIEGDNLEVLKLLRNSYYGKIKMIYIDPPYNTGNDFVYKDDYSISVQENSKNEGNTDKDGNKLIKNQEGSGRFHSNWMNMMYTRLKIAKDLLTDDGVIFISIDDNEAENLKKLCNEVFGEKNFISQFVWKSKLGKVGTTSTIATTHEYILSYTKNSQLVSFKMIEKENEGRKENLRQWGQADRREDRPSMFYPIIIDGITVYPVKEDGSDGRWRVGKEMAEQLLSQGCLELVKKDNRYDIYRNFPPGISIIPYDTLLLDDIGTTAKGSLALKELDMHKYFDYPKSVELISFFSHLCTSDSSLILDFFSGSATTAHSVMKLNAEDGGNRKFIMVQLPEECDEKSEAYKAGYKNICEIGKERIRRAGDKIKEDFQGKEGIENLDIGFKVFRVADTNIRWSSESLKEGQITMEDSVLKNRDLIDFNPGFTDIDVVYEIILRHRDLPLTLRIDKLSNIGERTYIFADAIVVCLEEKVTDKIVDGIAAIEPKPIKVIFRDSAFEDDISLKLNTMNRLDAQLKKHNQGKEQSYRVEFI